MFFFVAHDGHVFCAKFRGLNVLLTNEYGCQTWVNRRHACRLLGVKF